MTVQGYGWKNSYYRWLAFIFVISSQTSGIWMTECCQDQGAALSRAMEIIQGDSTSNGLLINFKKCQLLSKQDLSMFHPEILCYSTPDFEIFGAPIGSHDLCTAFIERKRKEANQLLSLLYVTPSLQLLSSQGIVLHSAGRHT